MYLKRGHQHRSSQVGATSANHVISPPVMHRRSSSLKPKRAPNAIKIEQHPIANHISVSSDDSADERDASVNEKTSLNKRHSHSDEASYHNMHVNRN